MAFRTSDDLPEPLGVPAGAERRRHRRVAMDGPARIRVPKGPTYAACLVDLSEGGACVAFAEPPPIAAGKWLVLAGERPLQNGYDARVIHAAGNRLHVAFDRSVAELGVLRAFLEQHGGAGTR